MRKINIGVIDEDGPRPMLVLTLLHEELYQQVLVDNKVDSRQLSLPTDVGLRTELRTSDAKSTQPLIIVGNSIFF